MIRQKELKKYLEIQERAQTESAGLELHRKDLLRRLAEGEDVENGKLQAVVVTSSRRSFSAEALSKLLGVNQVAQLKEQLPETVSRSLKVLPTG